MKPDLNKWLWPKGPRGDIWAIVDAAQDPKVYWALVDSYLNSSCLFAGSLPKEIEMVAPYLVQLDADDKFTEFLSNQWGKGACVYLQCDTSMKVLRHHLRKFLTVHDPAGRRLLFRYYDPHVLRVFLPPCNTEELKTVFGPVQAYWTESDDPNVILQFQFDGRSLKVTERTVRESGYGSGQATPLGQGPEIFIGQRFLVVPNVSGERLRVPIILSAGESLDSSGGKIKRSSPGARLFRSAQSTTELLFRNNVHEIPPGSFTSDLTYFAEGVFAGEVEFTLDLGRGAVATASITVVDQ